MPEHRASRRRREKTSSDVPADYQIEPEALVAPSALARPRISLLSPEQIAVIHESSLRIVAHAGVRVDSERARKVFRQAGDGVRLIDNKVYLESEVVEWALRAAPSTLDIYDRRGERAFSLGDQIARFGVGVTNLYYQDPVTDQLAGFSRKHMETGVRLSHALPQYDVISTLGILRDLPPTTADLYAVLEMVANTTKPLVLLISAEDLFPAVLTLLERLHGDLGAKPFVMPYLNPVTPLVLNEGTADKLLDSVERGIPFIYSNYGMAGASTPILPAAALAFLNAELMVGVVLSQLAREGAPIILGSLPAYFDMKTMVDFYDPRTFVINLGCAEMLAHYGLPHAGTSGSGEGWGLDLLAAGNLWLNHLTSVMGKVGLVPFVGSSLNSKAYSPALTVYAHDVIGQARMLARGMVVDEAALGVNEALAVMASDGHFLTSDTTLKVYRSAGFHGLFPHLGLEKWVELESPRAEKLLRDRTCDLIASAAAPDDHDELMTRGEAVIQKLVHR